MTNTPTETPTFDTLIGLIQNNDPSAVTKISDWLSHGNKINTANDHGATLLHYACASGNEDVVRFLLANGSKSWGVRSDTTICGVQAIQGVTPLHLAAKQGHRDIVQYLLNAGVDNRARTRWIGFLRGDTPADMTGNEDIENLINNSRIYNFNSVYSDIKRNNLNAAIQKIEAGADISGTDRIGNTMMHLATIYGNEDLLKCIIETGVDLNSKNNQGRTPLYGAVDLQTPDVLKLLQQNGADFNVQDNNGQTPLVHALSQSKLNTSNILYLINIKDVNVNLPSTYNETALHFAAYRGEVEIMQALISRGAKIGCKTNDGNTPLHLAVSGNNLDCVVCLLNHGADISEVNNSKKKPLEMIQNPASRGVSTLGIRYVLNARQKEDDIMGVAYLSLKDAISNGHFKVAEELARIYKEQSIVLTAEHHSELLSLVSGNETLQRALSEINARDSFIRAIENSDFQLAYDMLKNGQITLEDVNEIRNSGTLNNSSLSICNAVVSSYDNPGTGDIGENIESQPETPVSGVEPASNEGDTTARNASEGEVEETIRVEDVVMALPDTPVTDSAIEMTAPRQLDQTQLPVDPISLGEEGGQATIPTIDVSVPEVDLTVVLEGVGVREPVNPDAHQQQGASAGATLDESAESLREEDKLVYEPPATEQSFQPFQSPRQTNTPIRITPVSIDVEPAVFIQPITAAVDAKAPEMLQILEPEPIQSEDSSIPLIIETNLVKREPQIEETNSAETAAQVAPAPDVAPVSIEPAVPTAGGRPVAAPAEVPASAQEVAPAPDVAPVSVEPAVPTAGGREVGEPTEPQPPVVPTRPEDQSGDSSSQPNGQQNQIQVIRHQYGDLGENDSRMDHREALDFANARNRSRLDRRRSGRRNRNRPTPYQTAINNIRKMEELGLLPKGPNGESNADVYLYRLYQAREFYHPQEYLMIEGGEYRRVSDLFRSRDGKSLNRVYSNLIARELSDEQLRAYAITILTAERCIDNKGHDRTRHRGRVLDRYSYRPGEVNNIEETNQTIPQKLNSAGEIVPEYTREEVTTDRRVAFITNESKMV